MNFQPHTYILYFMYILLETRKSQVPKTGYAIENDDNDDGAT
jgi:hypothetical protein